MNSNTLKMCFKLLRVSKSKTLSNLRNQNCQLTPLITSNRSYYLDFILGGGKYIHPSSIALKRSENEETTFQSFKFLETYRTLKKWKQMIQSTLQCTKADASNLLQKAQAQMIFNDPELFFEKLRYLNSHGLNAKIILENIWLFNYSLGELEHKLQMLKNSNSENFQKIPLMKLSKEDLYELMINLKQDEESSVENRIDFFAREFSLSIPDVCELLLERSFLRRKSLREILSIYRLLLDHGITANEIKADFWVFRFSKSTVLKRIHVAKTYNLKYFKCWMIRCSLNVLKRTAEIWNNNQAALDVYSCKTELLMNSLGVSKEDIEELFSKYPGVQHVSEAKIKQIIEFFVSENFTCQQIYKSPRVFCHSLSTLRVRLDMLRNLDYKIQSLSTLCKNKKDFHNFIKYLKSQHNSLNLENSNKSSFEENRGRL